ncbi:MAG: hypothetical protein ABWY55_10990 [Microbacterium sp.]
MPTPQPLATANSTAPTTALPGADVIARIRRLVITALVSGAVYSMFTAAGKSGCAGGIDGEGGFVDANGQPTELVPSCVSLVLRPSPLLLLALAVLVVWAITRVLRSVDGEASAIRTLDRTALAIMIVAGASIVVAQAWFALVPLDGIGGTGTYVHPFPFATVEFESSLMTLP